MKSRRVQCSFGAHRWMISYADLVTLLLACFVVMYAMAPGGNATAKTPDHTASTVQAASASPDMALPFDRRNREVTDTHSPQC